MSEDLAVRRADSLQRFNLTTAVLTEYGRFIADLAPWSHFVTLTHDPRRLPPGHTKVGQQRHRKQLRAWVHEDVRALDPSARWWSEMEHHASGQCHEHGLLCAGRSAPVLSMRQAWFDRCGYAKVVPIDARSLVTFGVTSAAEYVAKYTGKATAVEPVLAGFGVLAQPSFSRTFGAALR